MSNLFLPDGRGGYTQGVKRLELPPIEIPQHLREDLEANPALEPKFYQAVQKAMDMSLNDPRTRLREMTVAAAKERLEFIYEAVVVMRHDMKFPLKKCFDLLPAALMECLLGGLRLDDEMAHEGRDEKWWKGPGGPQTSVVEGLSSEESDDITPDGAEKMEVTEDEPDE